MTKFDHKVNLPQIFQKNKLSILPLTRGSYRIGHYDIFKEIKDINKKIKNFQIPNNIKSIDPKNLYSETSVLHSAYATGMLHDLFNIENNDFLIPTISGRMSSKNFEKLSESTIERRSQTVRKWIEWIVKQIYKND